MPDDPDQPPAGEAACTPASNSPPQSVADLREWFAQHCCNSAISLKTQIFNEVHAVKERLRGFLHHLDAE